VQGSLLKFVFLHQTEIIHFSRLQSGRETEGRSSSRGCSSESLGHHVQGIVEVVNQQLLIGEVFRELNKRAVDEPMEGGGGGGGVRPVISSWNTRLRSRRSPDLPSRANEPTPEAVVGQREMEQREGGVPGTILGRTLPRGEPRCDSLGGDVSIGGHRGRDGWTVQKVPQTDQERGEGQGRQERGKEGRGGGVTCIRIALTSFGITFLIKKFSMELESKTPSVVVRSEGRRAEGEGLPCQGWMTWKAEGS
jgi:hypothetical protein